MSSNTVDSHKHKRTSIRIGHASMEHPDLLPHSRHPRTKSRCEGGVRHAQRRRRPPVRLTSPPPHYQRMCTNSGHMVPLGLALEDGRDATIEAITFRSGTYDAYVLRVQTCLIVVFHKNDASKRVPEWSNVTPMRSQSVPLQRPCQVGRPQTTIV